LQKTINAARGVLKRRAAGLPDTSTPEERKKWDKTFARIDAKLAVIDEQKKGGR
jgi:hypothetical protein